MRASFSAASAWSRAASAAASRRLNSGFGGAAAPAGSGLIRVSEPTAASMHAAQPVVDPDAVELGFGALPAGLPEIASVRASWLPSGLPMSTSLSDLRT